MSISSFVRKGTRLAMYLAFLGGLAACGSSPEPPQGLGGTDTPIISHDALCDAPVLSVRGGSENESLKSQFEEFNRVVSQYLTPDQAAAYRDFGYKCAVTFESEGTAEISRQVAGIANDIELGLLDGSTLPFNAVLPAQSRWIQGEALEKVVVDSHSIMTNQVVMAIKPVDAARYLPNLTTAQLQGNEPIYLTVEEACDLWARVDHVAMTNATHSNSGNTAAVVCLGSFAGDVNQLETSDATDEAAGAKLTELLAKVKTSSGSTSWLNSEIVRKYDDIDLVGATYEVTLKELNESLRQNGKEQLLPIYSGFIPIDSPLAYIDDTPGYSDDREDLERAVYTAFAEFLLSPQQQAKIAQSGRRPVSVGLPVSVLSDLKQYNIHMDFQPPSTFEVPKRQVLAEVNDSIRVYFRLPSGFLFVADYSGSMLDPANGISGESKEGQMERSMGVILDPEQARQANLQATEKDVFVAVPYGSEAGRPYILTGNKDQERLDFYFEVINEVDAIDGQGTNTYGGLLRAMEVIRDRPDLFEGRNVIIVVMSDGITNEGILNADRFVSYLENVVKVEDPALYEVSREMRVFTISFGENAEKDDLKRLAAQFNGRHFHADTREGLGSIRRVFSKISTYN